MNTHVPYAKRVRRRRGVSQSGIRRIEKIAALGERAVKRQFVAVDRGAITEGGRYGR